MERSEIEKMVSADTTTFHRDGTITAKWEYFYRFGRTPEKYAEKIERTFPGVEIIDTGDHFHDFVGGAKPGSAKSSYMWVRFKVNDRTQRVVNKAKSAMTWIEVSHMVKQPDQKKMALEDGLLAYEETEKSGGMAVNEMLRNII